MQRTSVASREGTGKPRKWAIQTPSGSIDAAASDATSIFVGVLGMIIEETRITIVAHDRCPRVSVVGTITQVLSSAIAAALTSMYARPRSIFDCGLRVQRRTYTSRKTEKAMAATSMTTAAVRTGAPIV